jgi:hypothetical protein
MPATKRLSSPTLTVHVDAVTIAESIAADSSHCMISDAITKQFPNLQKVSTDLITIRFSDPETGLRYIYWTPRSAQERIVDFDEGIDVDPFSFRLKGAVQIMKRKSPDQQRDYRKRRAQTSAHGKTNIPLMEGGRPPPRGSISGTRRTFGIKGLRGAKSRAAKG